MIKPLIESKDVFLLISILLQTIRPCLGLDLGWLVEDKMEDVSSFPKHHLFFFCVCPFLSYACVFTPLSFFSCTPLRLFTSMRPSLWCPIWATCPMPRSLSETFAWSPRSQQYGGKGCWLSIYLTIGVTKIKNFGLSTLFTGSWCFHWWCILLAAANRLLVPQYQSQPLPATPFFESGPTLRSGGKSNKCFPRYLVTAKLFLSTFFKLRHVIRPTSPQTLHILQSHISYIPCIFYIPTKASFWVDIITFTINILICIIDTMSSNRVIVFNKVSFVAAKSGKVAQVACGG